MIMLKNPDGNLANKAIEHIPQKTNGPPNTFLGEMLLK